MLTCPMCKKKLRGLEKECLNCRTDVSLLVHYVEDLREGLAQAEALTRAGELGEAVWAYLGVLEVDPDNATARRQVGKVATAVRQFDQTAPGRRWLKKLRKQTRFRRWVANWNPEGETSASLLSGLLWFLLIFGALIIGYVIGVRSTLPPPDAAPATDIKKPDKPDKGKPPAEGADKRSENAKRPPPYRSVLRFYLDPSGSSHYRNLFTTFSDSTRSGKGRRCRRLTS